MTPKPFPSEERTTMPPTTPPGRREFWQWLTTFGSWPSFDRLLFLTYGVRIMAVIQTLAELRVADHLDEPRTADELAVRIGADPRALFRVLRAAAGLSLLTFDEQDRCTLTEEGASLRSSGEETLHDLVLHSGGELSRDAFASLTETVRTGKCQFETVFGSPFYAYLDAHPDHAELFDRTMMQRSWLTATILLGKIDLAPYRTIADLGGGGGHFFGEACARYPGLTGVLLEQPRAAAHARTHLAGLGLADRVAVREGDFFGELPSGMDLYTLNAVLNGLSDEDAVTLLRNVRATIGDDTAARLCIFEKAVAPAVNDWDYSKLIDLDMLVFLGGRERVHAEWTELTAAAGFRLLTPEPTGGSPWSALLCRPA